jgi:hypothetical protein
LITDLQSKKIELAKMLLETEDTSLLDEIKALFVKREKYFWDDLPIHVKARIKKSIKQSKMV